MVLTHPLFCPVRCVEGHPFDEAVHAILAGRSYAIVTSSGWVKRGTIDRLTARCGAAVAIVDQVESNPVIGRILDSAPQIAGADVVVALGGGSVIDAVKGMVALNAMEDGEARLLAHLRDGVALPDNLSPAPIIAVPTTSGTGSEVTRWGTIWGEDGIKFSVTSPHLFPTHAILDPDLCCSMPRDLTLATGLDALSHAMESVWNRRHSDATDMLAEQAIRLIRESLPGTLAAPEDRSLRQRMQTAALLAGMAMGTTQTALAHSISYPFTSRFGMPHGIACSFVLAEVVRYNAETDAERLLPIARGFDCDLVDLADVVERFMVDLGIGAEIARYVDPSVTDQFGDNLITRARAANNIRDIDGAGARGLAATALSRLYIETPSLSKAGNQ